jgi:hypothetical protein
MFRTTLHLILIAGLLACPVRCFARSVVSSADGSVQSDGCSCCGGCDTESDAGEKSKDCPDDGCDCGNCICNGAITQNDADVTAAVDFDFCVFLAPIEVLLSSNTSLSVYPNQDQRHAHRYLSGRDARIAHQSWLI